MLLDSYTMTICCPACRAVTSPGNNLISLRTNEHALRVLELEETIQKLKKQDNWYNNVVLSCFDEGDMNSSFSVNLRGATVATNWPAPIVQADCIALRP